MPKKHLLLACAVLCLFSGKLALAADLPAVSGPNGKLSIEGGAYDDEAAGLALGSFALPLGYAVGLQADGAIGNVDGDILGGGGLHLFTRDPSSYLLGVYGSYHTWNSIDVWRLAGEAELYLGRFTVSGLAGYESLDVPGQINSQIVLTPDDKHFFGQGDVAYYINDDFKIYGGYRYINETSFGSAGAEYLLRDHGVPVSLFARRLRQWRLQRHFRRTENLPQRRQQQIAHRSQPPRRSGSLHAGISEADDQICGQPMRVRACAHV